LLVWLQTCEALIGKPLDQSTLSLCLQTVQQDVAISDNAPGGRVCCREAILVSGDTCIYLTFLSITIFHQTIISAATLMKAGCIALCLKWRLYNAEFVINKA
jgi:hypothetical protein